MFRVGSYQAVLRILFASTILMVAGALAQDQPDQKNAPPKDAASPTQAQPTAAQAQPAAGQAQPEAVDPLTRPTNEKQKKKNQRALKQELSKPYKKWLDEDVVWII